MNYLTGEAEANKPDSRYRNYEYYSVDFELGDKMFNGTIYVGVDENGGKHFYDINKIHTVDGIAQPQIQEARIQYRNGVSDVNIPQNQAAVNTQNENSSAADL